MNDTLEDRLHELAELQLDLVDGGYEPSDYRNERPLVRLYARPHDEQMITLCMNWPGGNSKAIDLSLAEARQLASLLIDFANSIQSEVTNTCNKCKRRRTHDTPHACPPRFECSYEDAAEIETIYAETAEQAAEDYEYEFGMGDHRPIKVKAADGTVTIWGHGPYLVQKESPL